MEGRGYLQVMIALHSNKKYSVLDRRLIGPHFLSGNSRPEYFRAHHELNSDSPLDQPTAQSLLDTQTSRDIINNRHPRSTIRYSTFRVFKTVFKNEILCFVDRASWYIRVTKPNLMQSLYSVYILIHPLQVSGIFVVHHQELHRIYTTIDTYCWKDSCLILLKRIYISL